jgi:hypothetical protein
MAGAVVEPIEAGLRLIDVAERLTTFRRSVLHHVVQIPVGEHPPAHAYLFPGKRGMVAGA